MKKTLFLLVGLIFILSIPAVASQEWEQYQRDAQNTGGYMSDVTYDSWKYETEEPVLSTAVRSGDSVYFIDSSGRLYSVAASGGQTSWVKNRSSSLFKSPVISNLNVYFAERDGEVYAFKKSGNARWNVDTRDMTISSPAVKEGTVYVGTGNSVRALNEKDGSYIWEIDTGSNVIPPVTVADSLYVSSYEREAPTQPIGYIHSVNSASGSIDWTFSEEGVLSPPAVGERYLFVGSTNGEVYGLEKQSGEVNWRRSLGTVVSAPTLKDGTVYYGVQNETVYALNSTDGTVKWKFNGSGRMSFSPAVVDGVVYANSDIGNVYALDAQKGEEVWSVSVEERVYASPTVAGETVYVSTQSGVYALNNRTVDSLEEVTRDERIVSIPNGSSTMQESLPYSGSVEGTPNRSVNETEGAQRDSVTEPRVDSSQDITEEETEEETEEDIESNEAKKSTASYSENRGSDSTEIHPVLYPFFFGLLMLVAMSAYFLKLR